VPWDFGQSVTERALSLDVTSGPPLRTEGPSSTRQNGEFVHARFVNSGRFIARCKWSFIAPQRRIITRHENFAAQAKESMRSRMSSKREFILCVKSGPSPRPLPMLAVWKATCVDPHGVQNEIFSAA